MNHFDNLRHRAAHGRARALALSLDPRNPLDLASMAIARRIEARQRAAKIAQAVLLATGAAALCAALWALAPDHRLTRPVKLVALDAAGESWIAGEGDDCAAALTGAQLPAGVVSVSCQH